MIEQILLSTNFNTFHSHMSRWCSRNMLAEYARNLGFNSQCRWGNFSLLEISLVNCQLARINSITKKTHTEKTTEITRTFYTLLDDHSKLLHGTDLDFPLSSFTYHLEIMLQMTRQGTILMIENTLVISVIWNDMYMYIIYVYNRSAFLIIGSLY